MRPTQYLSCTTFVLLLAVLSSVSSLQETTSDETTTTSSTAETTTRDDSDVVLTSTTTAGPTSTSKAVSSTTQASNASSTTKRPTAKPTTTSTTTTTTTTIKPPVVNCLMNCTCPDEREMICEGLELKQLPKLDSKSTFVRLSFAHNDIEVLDFKQLRSVADKLEYLDLSDNRLRSIVPPTKRSFASLPQLTQLNLTDNRLESISDLNTWSMPNLEQLDVSLNLIKQLYLGPQDSRPNLTKLLATNLPLSVIDDQALAAAPRLKFLNLSSSHEGVGAHFLNNLAFAKNAQLQTLDLSFNQLSEVPAALRNLNRLKKLILNRNLMTSLRMTDFINLTNLEHLELRDCVILQRVDANALIELRNLNTLIISSNKRFSEFSPDAFVPISGIEKTPLRLKLFDLSSNNLTTLNKLNDDRVVTIEQLRLGNNPLDCNCQLEWLIKMPNLSQQQPIHCFTPRKYHDLELSQFFEVHECTEDDSMLQRCVVTLCILFLVLVTIAVFVQKTDLCRRLRWRDQYGTIYYTKASFPQEQL